MNEELYNLIQDVINSEDNTGCSDDLTVASKDAVDKLNAYMIENYPMGVGRDAALQYHGEI